MQFPFVSRARFEDRERQILELKQEMAALKEEHARVLDEIVFRSTNFHLHERFDKKREEPVAPQPEPKAEPLGPIADAINRVGTRPSAIRQFMESKTHADYLAEERKAMDVLPSKAVQDQLERALKLGTERAQAPPQA